MTNAQKPSFAEKKNAEKKKQKATANEDRDKTGSKKTAGSKGYNWEWPPEVIAYLNAVTIKCRGVDKKDRNTFRKANIDTMLIKFESVLSNHGEARTRGDRYIRNAVDRVTKSDKSTTATGVTFRKERRQNAADLWSEQPDIKKSVRDAVDDDLAAAGLAGQAANKARPGKLSAKKAELWKEFKIADPEGAEEWEERAKELAKTEVSTLKETVISNQSNLRTVVDAFLSKLDGTGKKQAGPMTFVAAYGFIDVSTNKVRTVVISGGQSTPSGLAFPEFANNSVAKESAVKASATKDPVSGYSAMKGEFAKFSACTLRPLADNFFNEIDPSNVDDEIDSIDVDALDDESSTETQDNDDIVNLFKTESVIVIDDDDIDVDMDILNVDSENKIVPAGIAAKAGEAHVGTNKTLDWGNKTGGTAFVSGLPGIEAESTDAKMLSREEQILLDKVVQVARAAVNSKPSTSTPTPTDTPSVNPISNAPSTVEDTKANADNSIHHDGEPKGTASSAGRLDKKKGKAAVKSSGHRGVKRKASEIAHDEPEMVNHTVVPAAIQPVTVAGAASQPAEKTLGRGKRSRTNNPRYEQ